MEDDAEKEKDTINLKYEASPDKHGVIDGRVLAAKLIEDAFILLVPYAKGCRECSISLFTGIGNRMILNLVKQTNLNGRICSYFGKDDHESKRFFELHRDESQAVTDELLEAGVSARSAGARHEH
jgi:hypothetical protein